MHVQEQAATATLQSMAKPQSRTSYLGTPLPWNSLLWHPNHQRPQKHHHAAQAPTILSWILFSEVWGNLRRVIRNHKGEKWTTKQTTARLRMASHTSKAKQSKATVTRIASGHPAAMEQQSAVAFEPSTASKATSCYAGSNDARLTHAVDTVLRSMRKSQANQITKEKSGQRN